MLHKFSSSEVGKGQQTTGGGFVFVYCFHHQPTRRALRWTEVGRSLEIFLLILPCCPDLQLRLLKADFLVAQSL